MHAEAIFERAPSMLVTHHCAIDKKDGQGRSKVEHLSFLPLQLVSSLPESRAGNLRRSQGNLQPYEAMYLGEVPSLGECYVMLTMPFTVPTTLLGTELQRFTAAEHGIESDETRLVATVHEHRLGRLDHEPLELFRRKWAAHWTRLGLEPVPG